MERINNSSLSTAIIMELELEAVHMALMVVALVRMATTEAGHLMAAEAHQVATMHSHSNNNKWALAMVIHQATMPAMITVATGTMG